MQLFMIKRGRAPVGIPVVAMATAVPLIIPANRAKRRRVSDKPCGNHRRPLSRIQPAHLSNNSVRGILWTGHVPQTPFYHSIPSIICGISLPTGFERNGISVQAKHYPCKLVRKGHPGHRRLKSAEDFTSSDSPRPADKKKKKKKAMSPTAYCPFQ